MQQTLIPGLSPPKREGIYLQRCDVLEMLGTVKGADLVIADPPWLLYKLDGTPYRDTSEPLKNGWMSPPTEHSEKPIDWQAGMIRKWVPPGGLVVDLYAGRGSVARAVLRAGDGRRYVGAEIDPDRHASAMALIAQEGTCP